MTAFCETNAYANPVKLDSRLGDQTLLRCFNPHFCSLKRRKSLLFYFTIFQQTDARKSRTYGEIIKIPVLFAPLLRKKKITTQHNYMQVSPCGSFSGHSDSRTEFSPSTSVFHSIIPPVFLTHSVIYHRCYIISAIDVIK